MLRPGARSLRLGAVLAAAASAAVLAISGVSSPASAESGLERAVGPVSPADRLLLPTDPKLWGAYQLAETPDLCRPGSMRCVNTTIDDMHRRFEPLAANCSHNAVFSLLYLRVTEGYRDVATRAGYFIDVAKVNKEDTDFARLYTQAEDWWSGGNPAEVSPIWRLAFAAADGRRVSGSGDALLGMVGHIKRDLPFAIWRIAMGHRDDHLAINPMLKKVYPTVSAELAARFDPWFSPDGGRLPTGEAVVDAIATWRDQAWNDAQALLDAQTPADFDEVAMHIERSAWDYGLSIYRSTRYTLDSQRADREAYCRSQQQSAG